MAQLKSTCTQCFKNIGGFEEEPYTVTNQVLRGRINRVDMFKNKLQKTAIFGTFCAISSCWSCDEDLFKRLGSKKSWKWYLPNAEKMKFKAYLVTRKRHLLWCFRKDRKVSWCAKMEKCPLEFISLLVIQFPPYFAKGLVRYIKIWEHSLFCMKTFWGYNWDT